MNATNDSANVPCAIDLLKRPLFVWVYSGVLLMGIPCNLLGLIVFTCLTRRKNSNTVFMMNLAASDLFFCLTLPIRVAYYYSDQLIFNSVLCSISSFFFYVNLYTSIYFLTSLSVFRYVAILHPVHSKRLLTFRRSVWISLGIWVLVGSSSTPFLNPPKAVNQTLRCFDLSPNSMKLIKNLDLMALTVGFLLPFFTIIYCYTRILWTLKHPVVGLPKVSFHNRRRSVHMITVVLISFLVCFLPYHLSRTINIHFRRKCSTPFIVAAMCLVVANSCLNPLLYYFVGSSFRTALTSSLYRTVRKSRLGTADGSGGSVMRLTPNHGLPLASVDQPQSEIENLTQPSPQTPLSVIM